MRLRLVSIDIGIKNGIIFVASTSRGKPPAFVDDIATLIIPNIAIRTAGSRDGIDWRSGKTSSLITHLSKDSTNFPRHIKQLTRTLNNNKNKRVVTKETTYLHLMLLFQNKSFLFVVIYNISLLVNQLNVQMME